MYLPLELQRDKFFRLRLIIICFCVAFVVSAIYVVVTYRLSADLGIKSELESLHKQAMLFHAEVIHAQQEEPEHDASTRLTKLVELVYLDDHIGSTNRYMEATGENVNWSLLQNMPFDRITTIKSDIEKAKEKYSALRHKESSTESGNKNHHQRHHPYVMINGSKEIDDHYFLWQIVDGDGHRILIIEVSKSFEESLSFIINRLTITSVIVLGVAIWLAIILSSWVGKKVKSKNDSLRKLAGNDNLTGLPNRLFLTGTMKNVMPEKPLSIKTSDQQIFSEVEAKPKIRGCLFVIDLDKFKEVNDAFGHSAGDHLLKKVSSRLLRTIDKKYILARVGGDEFIIWAPHLELEKSIPLAKELVSVCNEPVMINQLAVNTGASIGIAHYPNHATNIESLILCADVAMYDAKQNHSGWSVFNVRDANTNRERLRLRADLSAAFDQQQIKLYYQPKVQLADGKVIGVEGLARWYHPADGILQPSSFIDLIEQSGHVQKFGRYVIETAVTQLSKWQEQGIYISVAINLSPYNLLDLGLLNFTLGLLDKNDISPAMLEIELVESSTNLNLDQIAAQLKKFREAGIKLAIDDFGTGMSSLSYVSSLRVHMIKVDRSFVDNVEVDPKKQAIITTAITLAKSFKTKLLAEGIENAAQVDLLIEMGCLYGQGYHFGKPIPAEDMMALLKSKQPLPLMKG